MFHNEKTGSLEFDVPKILKAAGWDDTEENRDLMTTMLLKASQAKFPETERVVVSKNPEATKIAMAQANVTATIKKRKSRWKNRK